MHLPSITAACLAILALACTALALQMTRLQRSGRTILNGGILLGLGLLTASTLPILSRLNWTELAEATRDQVIAALHLLEVTYVILTL
ncbi:hypothetical protein RAD15_30455 [Bradyrhizobium sp. 14AA]